MNKKIVPPTTDVAIVNGDNIVKLLNIFIRLS